MKLTHSPPRSLLGSLYKIKITFSIPKELIAHLKGEGKKACFPYVSPYTDEETEAQRNFNKERRGERRKHT